MKKRISISTVPSFVTGHLVPFGSPSSRSTTVWTCLPDLDLFHLCLVNLSCLVYPPFLCCQLLKLTCVLPLLLISLFISPWMHFPPVCWTWFVLMDFVFRSIYLLGLFWLDFWPSPLASLKPSALSLWCVHLHAFTHVLQSMFTASLSFQFPSHMTYM